MKQIAGCMLILVLSALRADAHCGLSGEERATLQESGQFQHVSRFESRVEQQILRVYGSLEGTARTGLQQALAGLITLKVHASTCAELHGFGVIDLDGRARCLGATSIDEFVQAAGIARDAGVEEHRKSRSELWEAFYTKNFEKAAADADLDLLHTTNFFGNYAGRSIQIYLEGCPIKFSGEFVSEGMVVGDAARVMQVLNVPPDRVVHCVEVIQTSAHSEQVAFLFESPQTVLTVAEQLRAGGGGNNIPPTRTSQGTDDSADIARDECPWDGDICVSSEGSVSFSVTNCHGVGVEFSSAGTMSLKFNHAESGIGLSLSSPK